MNARDDRSPRITHVAWGEMEAEAVGRGRDMKLWPGGGREWDWNETNTHHVPGIQIDDVRELLERGSQIVILSRGMRLALQTGEDTLQYLEARGVRYHVLETREAVDLYNRLAERGDKVGGLFHSTC